MRLSALVLALIGVAGCDLLGSNPLTASKATTFACGLVDLLVEAADVEEIAEAFGADGIQDKVCAIFAVSDRTIVAEPQILVVELPSGVEVRAQAQPSGRAATE